MPDRRYIGVGITASIAVTSLLLLIPGRTDTTWAAIGLACFGWCIAVGLLIDLLWVRKPTRRILPSRIQHGNLPTSPRRNALASSSEVAQLREGATFIEVVVASQSNPLRSPTRESVDTPSHHSPPSGEVREQRPTNVPVACETLRDDYSQRGIEGVQVLSSSSPPRNDAQKD